MFNICY